MIDIYMVDVDISVVDQRLQDLHLVAWRRCWFFLLKIDTREAVEQWCTVVLIE